jgi:alcohol dehydrogenase YqhD (iron-dependent ADH family)
MLGWLRAHLQLSAVRIAGLGRRIFCLTEQEPAAAAAQTIARLHTWLQSVKAPLTLGDLNIPPEDIPRIADNTKSLARLWRLRDYTPERVEAIFRQCL